ncbi:hypothetical protein [Zooshikella ganghwensis]|uniref:hypothetical protein n=1 Tax=Zooshikella ganghwensis TaxID=202772 RepID=UPI000427BAA7|nr:hypothetical protein [Zooshikella ganghwensis]
MFELASSDDFGEQSSDDKGREYLVCKNISDGTYESLSDDDCIELYRFVHLARKVNFKFTELDLVLRKLCGNKLKEGEDIAKNTLRILAIAKYLRETYDLSIEEICALGKDINALGFGDDDDYPADLFNQTFNGKFAKADKKYIPHSSWGKKKDDSSKNDDKHPTQYKEYTQINSFNGDVLDNHEGNKDFRVRTSRALGLSEKQMAEIIRGFRARENEKYQNNSQYDQLWVSEGDADREDNKESMADNLLNTLYRTNKLMEIFGLSHSELFTILDVVERDALIRGATCRGIFIDLELGEEFNLQSFSPYDILRGEAEPTIRLWLIQVLASVVNWLNENELSVADLLMITTGDEPRDLTAANREEADLNQEAKELQNKLEKLTHLNQLYSQIKPSLLTKESFVGGSLDQRFSRLIHDTITTPHSPLIAPFDSRLVRFSESEAKMAAQSAIERLSLVTRDDFMGLSIEETIAQKISQNLILMGYLSTDGTLDSEMFPEEVAEFAVETDFTPVHDQLYDKIAEIHKNYVDAALYPSDLEFLGLTKRETEELYDNLIFNNYLESDGTLKQHATFESEDHKRLFEINSRIGVYAEEIYQHINDRLLQFKKHTVTIVADNFSELGLSEVEQQDILENLKWNEYLSETGSVLNKQSVLALTKETFLLTAKFYPHQQAILDILQQSVKKVHEEYAKFDKDFFAEVADKLVADWIYAVVSDHFLNNGRFTDEAISYFSNSENLADFDITWPFTDNDNRVVFQAIQKILATQNSYCFNKDSLQNLSFNVTESEELSDLLQKNGYLTPELRLEWNMLEYFLNSENAVLFTLKAFEDYSKDVFFILHELAKRMNTAVIAVMETLQSLDKQQDLQLYSALREIMGLNEASLETLTQWLFGPSENVREQWLLPILSVVNQDDRIEHLPKNIGFNIGYDRFKRFAKLSSKLKLDEHEINLVFHDQDLVEKLSETILLPMVEVEGKKKRLDSIDCLLESNDGYVYIFKTLQKNDKKTSEGEADLGQGVAHYWVYDSNTGELFETEDNKLSTLLTGEKEDKPSLEKDEKSSLREVQAAFVDSKGRDVLIVDGTYYVRELAQKHSNASSHKANMQPYEPYGSDHEALMQAKGNQDPGKFHQIPCMNTNPWQVMERQWGKAEGDEESFHNVDAAFAVCQDSCRIN